MPIKISNVFSFRKCKDILLLQHPVAILLSNLCLADFQITGLSLCEVLRHSIPPHDSLIIKRWLELIREYRIF